MKSGKDFEKGLNYSNDEAYKMCFSVFRGTPGDVKGMAYIKDKVYSEGSYMILQYLSSLDEFSDTALEKMLDGKFSINSEVHWRIIDALKGD